MLALGSSRGTNIIYFFQSAWNPRPRCAFVVIELWREEMQPPQPQGSSLPRYTDVLSFQSEAPTAPTSIQDLLAWGEVIR